MPASPKRPAPPCAPGATDGKGPTLYGQTEDRLSNSVTTVMMPEGHTSDAMRKIALERFNLSLGGGLGPLMGKVFRIGHLGDLNEPMLLGCLATTELAMKTAGVPFAAGGVDAAIEVARRKPTVKTVSARFCELLFRMGRHVGPAERRRRGTVFDKRLAYVDKASPLGTEPAPGHPRGPSSKQKRHVR